MLMKVSRNNQSKTITGTGVTCCIYWTSKYRCIDNRCNVFLAFVSRSTIHIKFKSLVTSVPSFCSTTNREIHVGFDKIMHPSIKDCERDAIWVDRLDSYNITVSSQKTPGNWLAALHNCHFKSSLIQYSARDNNSLATTLGEKKLFVNSNNDCYALTVKDKRMTKMCERSLYIRTKKLTQGWFI